jgi:hypothetical protein
VARRPPVDLERLVLLDDDGLFVEAHGRCEAAPTSHADRLRVRIVGAPREHHRRAFDAPLSVVRFLPHRDVAGEARLEVLVDKHEQRRTPLDELALRLLVVRGPVRDLEVDPHDVVAAAEQCGRSKLNHAFVLCWLHRQLERLCVEESPRTSNVLEHVELRDDSLVHEQQRLPRTAPVELGEIDRDDAPLGLGKNGDQLDRVGRVLRSSAYVRR